MNLKENNIVITSNLFRPHFGGVENSLYHLSKAYLELGYRPIVVVSNLPLKNEPLYKVESLEGIKVFRYDMDNAKKWLYIKWPKSIFGIISAIKMYRWVNKNFRPKFTITRYHFNQFFARISGLKKTVYLVPGVVKFQNAAQHIDKRSIRAQLQWYYHRLLQYMALRTATKVAVFSKNMKQQLLDINYSKPLLITKPGVDGERFTAKEKRNERQVILCVGRCVKAKGFDYAIRSMAFVSGDVELWIVGDGPLLPTYKQLARDLNVDDKIKFWGSKSSPERLYQQADFFLMSSVYEPLGQTLLEGLASGLPLIAFRPSDEVMTATEDVVGSDGASFVDELSAEALGQVIMQNLAWEDSKYYEVSASNRRLAERSYSWQALALDLLEVSK